MAKNLVDGENIVIEENGNNINMNLSNRYSNSLKRNLNIHSGTEQIIGTYMEKPLYRKVIDFGSLPNTTNKYVTHNINIETPVRCSGIVLNPNTGMKFTIPMPDIDIWLDINQVCVRTGSDRSATTGIAIIEYTKTTD